MRVTNQSVARSLIFEISRNYDRMNTYRLQVSSGKQINSFADSPRDIGRLKRFDALQSYNDRYLSNLTNARSKLESVDSALQRMAEEMSSLRELVQSQVSEGITNPETRANVAQAVRGMRDSFLAFANQQIEGTYLFGGHRNNRTPFSVVDDVAYYNGDDRDLSVQVGPTLHVETSVSGDNFMGTDSAVMAGTAELKPRVRGTTALADLNDGEGVGSGTISIQSGVHPPVLVDLSTATTVQDVIDAINAAGGGNFTASINANETGLQIVGPEPIAVGEVPGGSTAGDLGLRGTTDGTLLVGRPIQPRLTAAVDFSEIRGFDGALPLGTLRIVIDDVVTDVDLSGANDLGDVRTAIQALVPDMDVLIADGSISLELNRAASFRVESPPGDDTASVMGLTGQASPTRAFQVFQDVIDALENDDTLALRQSLVEIADVHQHLLGLNVQIGGRQVMLDNQETVLMEREQTLLTERSRIEDVDLINVATRLTFAETTYQAALASAAGIFRMTLLDYL